ncbi:hypothetical protein TWF730_008456 [Orbilia blumenaviensis]|uniref:Uncharacterized protein n=1 Tax=Orbilia blumenaviensis TaxID=1796055 RepID=A0AAV9V2I4_9PEZI
MGTSLFVVNPDEENCGTRRNGRDGSGFNYYPLYLDLPGAMDIPAIYLDGYDVGAQIRYPTTDPDLPFIMARDTRGYRPAYWIVKRGGRRIDPAVSFFLEGDSLEFVGSSMEQDHTIRLRDYGPGIGYQINRGVAALDNPRIELRYANNCFLRCCTKFIHCFWDLFGTRWRDENILWAQGRRTTIPAEGEDSNEENFGLQPAADILAFAQQLEELAAQLDAGEGEFERPVDEVTRVSVHGRNETEHDLHFWDNLLEDSPERPQERAVANQLEGLRDDHTAIELMPLPDIDESYHADPANGNRGGIELIPVQGHNLRDNDMGMEAQRGFMNDEDLDNAFRGSPHRSYDDIV